MRLRAGEPALAAIPALHRESPTCMATAMSIASTVQLRLVYASNGMDDILLKLPLDAMAAGYYGKFKVKHTSTIPGKCCLRAIPQALTVQNSPCANVVPGQLSGIPAVVASCSWLTGALCSAQALFVVNEAPDEGHHVSMGLIDKEMITKYVNAPPSEDVLMVVCGPRAFVADQAANLEELGYKNVVVIDDLPQITEGAAYMNTQGDHRFD